MTSFSITEQKNNKKIIIIISSMKINSGSEIFT